MDENPISALVVDAAIHIHRAVGPGLSVIVELKSLENLALIHCKQMLTYLKLTGGRLGLLLNFGAVLMRDGMERVVNPMPDTHTP